MRVLRRLRATLAELDTIELLFYLVVALFFVGKAYKPAVVLLDIIFLVRLAKDPSIRQRLLRYRSFVTSLLLFGLYVAIQPLFIDYSLIIAPNSAEEIAHMVMLLAAIVTFDNITRLRRLIVVAWVAVGVVLLDSIYQYFVGHDIFGVPTVFSHRLTAWREGKSLVGPMLGMFAGLFLVAPFIFERRWLKAVAVAMALATFGVMVLAGNRAPLLAMVSAVLFLALISRFRKQIVAVGLLFGMLFGAVMVANPELASQYKALLNPTTNTATSGRYHLFLVGWEMIKDNPVIGIGPEGYRYHFKTYNERVDWERFERYKMELYYTYHEIPHHVHSVAIDMVLAYGVVGFLLLLWMLWNFFRTFVLRSEYAKLAALGFFYCISPLAFSKAFTSDTWQFMTYLSMVFVVAVAQAFMDETAKSLGNRRDRRR